MATNNGSKGGNGAGGSEGAGELVAAKEVVKLMGARVELRPGQVKAAVRLVEVRAETSLPSNVEAAGYPRLWPRARA